MKVWKKSKGNRIRASDKSLVYHFCIEVAKKLTGILQVQSATESIANYTSNQHTAIYHRTVEEK